MIAHPHAPYANAVMAALADQYDPADSWTEYANDDGEVMLLEIVINLDPDKALAAGWNHGIYIYWRQTTGWEWCYGTNSEGSNSYGGELTYGLVTDPDDIARAVRALLTPGGERLSLPSFGSQRAHDDTTALPAPLQKAMDGEDIDRETAYALAVYSQASTPEKETATA
ncbi:hypothetical protein ACFV0C_37000 [Streptomyces sp. NPDC059568]|uniref:hypothetical protein n=1 Tax=Streptomyces sp. NPDC059568 TaxID=3346868 RepID=UPI0036CBD70B